MQRKRAPLLSTVAALLLLAGNLAITPVFANANSNEITREEKKESYQKGETAQKLTESTQNSTDKEESHEDRGATVEGNQSLVNDERQKEQKNQNSSPVVESVDGDKQKNDDSSKDREDKKETSPVFQKERTNQENSPQNNTTSPKQFPQSDSPTTPPIHIPVEIPQLEFPAMPIPSEMHLKKLGLTSICSDNESERKWAVQNPNDVSVTFKWNVVGTNQSGPGTVPPHDKIIITTKTVNAVDILSILVDGCVENQTISFNDKCNPVPTPEQPKEILKLISMCSDNPSEKRKWKIRNLTSTRIEFKWGISGTDITGQNFVDANGEKSFETPAITGDNIVVIFVDNVERTRIASIGTKCGSTGDNDNGGGGNTGGNNNGGGNNDNHDRDYGNPSDNNSKPKETPTPIPTIPTLPNGTDTPVPLPVPNSPDNGGPTTQPPILETPTPNIPPTTPARIPKENHPPFTPNKPVKITNKNSNITPDLTPNMRTTLPATASPWYNVLLISGIASLLFAGWLIRLRKQ